MLPTAEEILPVIYGTLNDVNWETFKTEWDELWTETENLIKGFARMLDPGMIDSADLGLLKSNFDVEFESGDSETTKRKRLDGAVAEIKSRATLNSARLILNAILGFTPEILTHATLGYWKIGVSKIGISTRLKSATTWTKIYIVVGDVSAAVLAQVQAAMEKVRPPYFTILLVKYTVATIPSGTWKIGIGKIGITTKLFRNTSLGQFTVLATLA